MKKDEVIKKLEELFTALKEQVSADELTDYARYYACVDIDDAIEVLKENEYHTEW